MTLDGQRQANECELQRVTPAITALPIEQQRTAWDISIPCCEIASCARRVFIDLDHQRTAASVTYRGFPPDRDTRRDRVGVAVA